ncbi:NUDIX hydrolase [Bacillus pumilus]|uniref:NUDIX hydrolase n=1 Tax=Bacillus pumilus TaxID=1408 RepID=UPI00211E7A7E|nr:NUDIX domain-containing protein [Bacillus pumilus]
MAFWLLKKEYNTVYLYFQLRSPAKKDFPSLLDITAAGHLLADEQPSDGIREVEEELGLSIPFEDLTFAGVMQDEIHIPSFIDREFCHVYLYKSRGACERSITEKRSRWSLQNEIHRCTAPFNRSM